MKMIMTGGADSEHFEEIDAHFISMLDEKPRLLFIPLAGDEEVWDNGLERIKETFSTIEFEQIDMCLDLSKLNWNKLKKYAAIYIDGGNTFQLMSQIRHTHTYELFHRFLHQGGVINGDSAGAIVLGSHLETAHFGEIGDENEAGIISYQGLNFLGKWAVHCHYDSKEDSEIMDFVSNYGFPVLALHETSAVYIHNNLVTVFGKSPVAIFTQHSKLIIVPGSSHTL